MKNKTGSTSQPSQINNQGSLVSVPCPTKFGNYTEYGMSYDEANQRCEQLQAQGELSQNMPMTLPTPQPIKTDNSALLSQCLATAQKSYDSATDSLVDLYGGPAGIPINANNQEIRDQAEAQFSKDRANCYHKYGY